MRFAFEKVARHFIRIISQGLYTFLNHFVEWVPLIINLQLLKALSDTFLGKRERWEVLKVPKNPPLMLSKSLHFHRFFPWRPKNFKETQMAANFPLLSVWEKTGPLLKLGFIYLEKINFSFCLQMMMRIQQVFARIHFCFALYFNFSQCMVSFFCMLRWRWLLNANGNGKCCRKG